MKRLQVIDLARAFSILVVLAAHLGSNYISKPSQPYFLSYLWYRFWKNGPFGVTIFFVISGFVITRLIASEPGGLFNPDFKKFYARRIGRIFPLLILVCFMGIIIIISFSQPTKAFEYIFKDPGSPMTPAFWASIATFSFNWYQIFSQHKLKIGLHWGVLWSLAIEEQFYLFYPFILKRLRNERNLILFLSTLIISGPFSGELFFYLFPNSHSLEKNSFENFGFIAIGCLLYLASNQYENFLSKNRKRSLQFCFMGLILIGIFYWHNYVSVNYWWFFWGPPFLTILAPTFLAFGVFFFLLGGLHLKIFNSKYWSILGWIGKLSYGGYLYHPFILFLFWDFFTGKNEFLDFLTYIILTFGLAELSYRYFEVPANLFIRKLLSRQPSISIQ